MIHRENKLYKNLSKVIESNIVHEFKMEPALQDKLF